jgi:hypothetical protein
VFVVLWVWGSVEYLGALEAEVFLDHGLESATRAGLENVGHGVPHGGFAHCIVVAVAVRAALRSPEQTLPQRTQAHPESYA